MRPAYVVASADPKRRRDWARTFGGEDGPVTLCSGPLVECPLARGEARCSLLDKSTHALYDLDSITPTFLVTLLRVYPHRTLLFARDALTAGGRHRPAIKRFVVGKRHRDVCFGGL